MKTRPPSNSAFWDTTRSNEEGGGLELKDTNWAVTLFGYTHKSRSAFWQFIHSSQVLAP